MIGRPNLITNGSFEQWDASTTSQAWISSHVSITATNAYGTIEGASDSPGFLGWSINSGQSYLDEYTNGAPVYDGPVWLGFANGDISQVVGGLSKSSTYDLSLIAGADPSLSGNATLKIYWDGSLVDTITPLPSAISGHTSHVTLAASGTGSDTLDIKVTGGALLDDVRLTSTTGGASYDASGQPSAVYVNLADDPVYLPNGSYVVAQHAFTPANGVSQQISGITDVHGTAYNDNLNGSSGANSLLGGAGADTLAGVAGNDTLYGGDGNDSIRTGADFSIVNGNKGDDTITSQSKVGDWLSGGQGNDLIDLSSSSGHSIVNGNLGNDTLSAGSGGDILRGGQGADVIHGGAGNDWISGDRGSDTLDGGAGADSFHFAPGSGADQITDFSGASGDRIVIDSGMTYAISKQGADVLIDFGSGDHVLLKYQTTTFNPSWIVSV